MLSVTGCKAGPRPVSLQGYEGGDTGHAHGGQRVHVQAQVQAPALPCGQSLAPPGSPWSPSPEEEKGEKREEVPSALKGPAGMHTASRYRGGGWRRCPQTVASAPPLTLRQRGQGLAQGRWGAEGRSWEASPRTAGWQPQHSNAPAPCPALQCTPSALGKVPVSQRREKPLTGGRNLGGTQHLQHSTRGVSVRESPGGDSPTLEERSKLPGGRGTRPGLEE